MKQKIGRIIVWVFGCELVGVLGAFFTAQAIPSWYAALQKPALNPPNTIFGPVWTLLYACMGLAAYLVSQQDKQSRSALILFFVQLFVNAIWTPLFFGAHALGLALIDICFLFVLIVVTIIVFARQSKVAALLLVPYLGWVGFATYLNASIWALNR